MYRVKTKEEFELMKKEINQKVDSFTKDWDEFTRYVSPSYWRGMNTNFNPKKLKIDIERFEPATNKHLNIEEFRDEVMTDEEKDEWNTTQKYNL